MARLGDLKCLRALVVNNAPISDAGLVHVKSMTALEILDLGVCPVTDAGLHYIKDLPHLKVLNLAKTGVTRSAVEAIRLARPEVAIYSSFDPVNDD
jgi:hypothetical protein